MLVVDFRCFRNLHRYPLQRSLHDGPTGWPETSVTNCQATSRDIREARRPELHRGGSLKSQNVSTALVSFLPQASMRWLFRAHRRNVCTWRLYLSWRTLAHVTKQHVTGTWCTFSFTAQTSTAHGSGDTQSHEAVRRLCSQLCSSTHTSIQHITYHFALCSKIWIL